MQKLDFIAELDYEFIEKITVFIVSNIKNISQADDIREVSEGLYYITDNILSDYIDENTSAHGVCLIDNNSVNIELKNISDEILKHKHKEFEHLKKFFSSVKFDSAKKNLIFNKILFVEDNEFDDALKGALTDINSSSYSSSEKIDDSFIGLNPAEAEKLIARLKNIDKQTFYSFDRFIGGLPSFEILDSLFYFRRVLTGQVIASTTLPLIKSKAYKKLIPGDNTLISKDRRTYFSKCDGRLRWSGDSFEVSSVKIVDKSITKYPKPFVSQECLQVHGAISDSDSISSLKDMYIFGNIVNSGISVSGDLYVSGEIINCNVRPFRVGGNIICRRVKNSKIICDSNLLVTDEICDSILSIQQDILLDGEKQIIRGSEIECGSSVVCGALGGPGEIIKDTKIILKSITKQGIEIKKLNGLKIEIEKEYKKLSSKFSETTDKRDKGDNSKELAMMIKDINFKKIRLEKQTESIQKNIEELSQSKNAGNLSLHVAVRDIIKPGVLIKMNNFYTEIKEEKKCLSFILTKNGIAESRYSAGRIIDEESSSSGDIVKSRDQADIENLRRSIIIEASTTVNAINLGVQFCGVSKEKLISAPIYSSPQKSKIICVEFNENEISQELLNKYAPIKAATAVQAQSAALQKIKVEGASINECLEIISKKYKFDKDKIKYKIIKQGSSGVFGIGKSKFLIEAQIAQ